MSSPLLPVSPCDPPSNSSEVNGPCSPAAEGSDKMQASTIALMVASLICFCLLLSGFYWVARWRTQPAIAPRGHLIRRNAVPRSKFHELWAGWLPNNSQQSESLPYSFPHLSSFSRPKSVQSGAATSFASTGVLQNVVETCQSASYDLDRELTHEMGRISDWRHIQTGERNDILPQRGPVGPIEDTPGYGGSITSPHDDHVVGNVQMRDTVTVSLGAELTGSAVVVSNRDCVPVETLSRDAIATST